MQKPKEIILAVRLLYIGFILEFARVIINYNLTIEHILNDPDGIHNLIVISCIAVLLFAIVAFVSKGKNWARLLITLQFTASFIMTLFNIHYILQDNLLIGYINITQLALHAWATYLLFSKSGNKWFEKNNHSPKKSTE